MRFGSLLPFLHNLPIKFFGHLVGHIVSLPINLLIIKDGRRKKFSDSVKQVATSNRKKVLIRVALTRSPWRGWIDILLGSRKKLFQCLHPRRGIIYLPVCSQNISWRKKSFAGYCFIPNHLSALKKFAKKFIGYPQTSEIVTQLSMVLNLEFKNFFYSLPLQ